MKIYGYEYEKYIDIREQIQLAKVVIRNYIYIVKCDNLYLIGKQDISMLEIENYMFVGKMLGQDVYVDTIILRSNHNE